MIELTLFYFPERTLFVNPDAITYVHDAPVQGTGTRVGLMNRAELEVRESAQEVRLAVEQAA